MSYRRELKARIDQGEGYIAELQSKIRELDAQRASIFVEIEKVKKEVNNARILEMEEAIKESQEQQLLQG